MRKSNYKEFAYFEYVQTPNKTDEFTLGDVVINDEDEIGVIIQCHGNNEYRTDMFGNCCYDKNPKYSSIERANITNILINRPNLLD